jgi:hypothetical protein
MRYLNIAGAALAAAALAASSAPAAAQDRHRRTAEDIAREIREAAEAVTTVRDAVDESLDEFRFRGADRHAVERCRPEVERYGRMRVDDVRPYGRRSLRVYGTVDGGGWGDRDRWRSRYSLRSFTCTVRDDGRVKLKTRRLRR